MLISSHSFLMKQDPNDFKFTDTTETITIVGYNPIRNILTNFILIIKSKADDISLNARTDD